MLLPAAAAAGFPASAGTSAAVGEMAGVMNAYATVVWLLIDD